MQPLNFNNYPLQIKEGAQTSQIYDIVRRKYVALTPEEWVRQHVIHFLQSEQSVPFSLMAIEYSIQVNNMPRRCDIVVFNMHAKPTLIVECKASHVKITQDVFDQIARYNLNLRVPYLLVTNGLQHFCCKINVGEKSFIYLKDIPKYEEMLLL